MTDNTKDNYYIRVAEKAEKLVSALYLVAGLIDDRDPIKVSMKTSALEILVAIVALSRSEVKDSDTQIERAVKGSYEVLSLIQIARATGSISDMNAELLSQGFLSFTLALQKRKNVITKEMLHTVLDEGETLAMTPSLSPNSSYLFATKKSETTHTPTAMRSTFRDIDIRSRSHTTYVSEKDSQTIASSKPVQKQGVFKMRKLSRREQVLAHFVKGQDMSIKDISAKVKGCSEKTIQRELNSLVLDHVIERIGEKRWSRYILR